MKIAVWHNLKSGGGKRALFDHVQGLVARGHEVTCFCPDTADTGFLPLSSITTEKVYPLKDAMKKATKGIKYINSAENVMEKLKCELQHCKECAADINNGGFDVLLANSSAFFSIGHIGRYLTIPSLIYLGEPHRVLYEAKDDFIWRAPIKGDMGNLKYALKRIKQVYRMFWYSLVMREEYITARSYNTILVNSFFSRESIKRVYNLDAKVCYLGINHQQFKPLNTTKERFVMGLGSVLKHKGIENVINALTLVPQQNRPKLVWVGNTERSPYFKELEQLAEHVGVEIEFKSNIPDDELLETLSRACALLYFSHLEPFGLAPLEANACGTGVIAIAEGGIRETIKDDVNGYLVKDYSPQAIADLVEKFSSDLGFAKKFGEAARMHILEQWSLSKGIDELENRLQACVHSPKMSLST